MRNSSINLDPWIIDSKIPNLIWKIRSDQSWAFQGKSAWRSQQREALVFSSNQASRRCDSGSMTGDRYTQREERGTEGESKWRKERARNTPPSRVFGSICLLDARASTFWRLPLVRPCVTPLFPRHACDAVAQMHASPLARVLRRSRTAYRHFPVILIDHSACSLCAGPSLIAPLPFSTVFSPNLCTLSIRYWLHGCSLPFIWEDDSRHSFLLLIQ